MKIICACATDRGNYREVNQDAILVRSIQQKNKALILGAVFDGVGGLEHGEIASGALCSEMNRWFEELSKWINLKEMDKDIIFSHFRDHAELLNEKVRQIRLMQGIETGSTMSAILIIDGSYLVIQVGDSRIYKWKDDTLECITDDDVVAKYVEGVQRNYLSNYMGKADELNFTEYSGQIQGGETFLFCSDGFYHQLLESDFHEIETIKEEKALANLIKKLIQTMIARGEHDNISAGIIKDDKVLKKKKRLWISRTKPD